MKLLEILSTWRITVVIAMLELKRVFGPSALALLIPGVHESMIHAGAVFEHRTLEACL